MQENVYLDRMISTLSAAFAALATLLAAVGLYGVLAYTVAQRTREIGVRMALGADAGRVRAMVLRQVGGMTLVGGAIGIVGALALEKTARSLLFGLEGHDPVGRDRRGGRARARRARCGLSPGTTRVEDSSRCRRCGTSDRRGDPWSCQFLTVGVVGKLTRPTGARVTSTTSRQPGNRRRDVHFQRLSGQRIGWHSRSR